MECILVQLGHSKKSVVASKLLCNKSTCLFDLTFLVIVLGHDTLTLKIIIYTKIIIIYLSGKQDMVN